MTDIVERLRRWADRLDEGDYSDAPNHARDDRESADEIARLRAALRYAFKHAGDPDSMIVWLVIGERWPSVRSILNEDSGLAATAGATDAAPAQESGQ